MNKSNGWALILGASSGFGAATALALAGVGFNIIGVHLDRRATLANAERIAEEIRGMGREALFFNMNAADHDRRAEVIEACRKSACGENAAGIRVFLHSLAFGTLKPYIAADAKSAVRPADMDMTLDVMAHSFVYWTQDLFAAKLLKTGAQLFAMSSAGSHRAWPAYGPVSAAKAALEAHVRQLAVELAPHGIALNAIQAGVADTPAARRIPGSEQMFDKASGMNPGGRLTRPEDVAGTIAALAARELPGAAGWMTGNVIKIDGGEDIV
jgi:NAD(P)-dependent dehydrogenase (short-subunit alcohol dehydrogenase family)